MLYVTLSVWTLLSCATFLQGAIAAEWTYTGPHGTANWPINFPVCGKHHQSPINVFEGDVRFNQQIGPIKYTNYDTVIGLRMTLRNNGHAAAVALSGSPEVTIEGGGLPGIFRAYQFHFHWGSDVNAGSEHLLSGVAFPLELHIVHFNTKYSNPGIAASKADGLAVLGFMYEVSEEDNINYSGLVGSLPLVQTPGAPVDIPTMDLNSLLPNDLSKFYRYSGSLTTPPCNEVVTWTIFKEPIEISDQQLQGFRQLLDSHGHVLVNNFRPVQPLHGRHVTANFIPVQKPKRSYSDPNGWSKENEDGKDTPKSRQSPINIVTKDVVYAQFDDFVLVRYNSAEDGKMEMTNNGKTVKIVLADRGLQIKGGGLEGVYKADQLHFHWGSSSDQGSEHRIDDRSYPMEMHIVHYNSLYPDVNTACKSPKGLAVLAFLFEVSQKGNHAYDEIVGKLNDISTPDSRKSIKAVSVRTLLPDQFPEFYRYEGSLTTPSCNETVSWTVFVKPIPISEEQLQEFRSLKSSDIDPQTMMVLALANNFRPLQGLNGRVVYSNIKTTKKKAAGSGKPN